MGANSPAGEGWGDINWICGGGKRRNAAVGFVVKSVAATVVDVSNTRLGDKEIIGGRVVVKGPTTALGLGGNKPLTKRV